ncbi:FxSxx-COOH system tetratricopeptide repeat protein [Actinomadura bangladeshensis]|uniref:Tetratricopeptide repeat protein n=1 Tax=Actinomadura bangladeshensis TaxID=453573 RepID=A0A6L9Q7N9_9ACTN|nr:FxSxx-COOH system tetratricopeptide repeat protein [Actinomadura bangladeshensis]NEA21459.1 tetratricopeptide repeat protein [Actinomadura bangladeshensis]
MANPGTIVTFYSYKGGTGRTSALANVAWIMAAAGRKVLAIDWDLESPGLHKYFHPFLDQNILTSTPGVIDMLDEYSWATTNKHPDDEDDWHREYARVLRHAVTLEYEFPGEGTLDFVSAGRQNRNYSSLTRALDFDHFYGRLGGGQFFDALRDDMRSNYDYVLIDSRTGYSDIADICTLHFPDVLVDCFTLSYQSIDGAADIAGNIDGRHHVRPIRILPVPMRIDLGENAKVEAGRAYARARFDRFPRGMSRQEASGYWLSVEIPYRPYYAFEETLATFGDAPGSPNSMLAAFERLTKVITDGDVGGYVAVEEEVRLATLERFTRRGPTEISDVVISYVSADRPWVDWMALILGRAGFRVVARSVDAAPAEEPEEEPGEPGGHAIVLLSPDSVSSPEVLGTWESLASRTAAPHRRLTAVRIQDASLRTAFGGLLPLDLTGLGEHAGAEALVRALGRPGYTFDQPAEHSRVGPRFPGAARTAPEIWNADRRNAMFTGRGRLLERLRDELLGTTQRIVMPQALHGLGGVGKTQVALEYIHRFKADYSLVWWISAQSPDSIRAGLANLAEQMGLRVGDNKADAAAAALEALRRGEPTSRWLLVFDNADSPVELGPFLPGGDGHILITSRDPAWTQFANPLPVEVFTRREAAEHLRRRVPEISEENAFKIGKALGNLPLAIEQAAAWLASTFMPAAEYLDELEHETASTLERSAQSFPQSVAMTWRVTFRQLREASPAAARLLELLAFFSSEPISLDLIYSDETAGVLAPYDETLRDKLVLGKHVREISRFALAKVDQGNNSIQVHPLVQAVIRHGLDPELTRTTCHDVHKILLGARPKHGDTDDPANWPNLEEILPHVRPSAAAECDDEDVRQMLTDLVRYQWKRGVFDSAMAAGRELVAEWSGKLGQDHWQWLFLQSQIANVLRSMGEFREAYDLDRDVLERQRNSPTIGPTHPHTLITAGNFAADMRAMGEYREALKLDLHTYEQSAVPWGEDHPRTLMVAHNLAIDYRLTGDWESAYRYDKDTLEQRRVQLGDDHPYTLFSEANLARDLREAGRFDESVRMLRDVYRRYLEVLGDQILDTLRTGKSLAVSLRRAGLRDEALALAEEIYARYQRHFPDSPDTLPADLEVAACMGEQGDVVGARDRTRAALARHREQMGAEHPFTVMIENNLGCHLRGTGELEEACSLTARAAARLEAMLGAEHPFVPLAAVNHANALGDAGRFAEAEEVGRDALERLKPILGGEHPDTHVCRSDLAITLDGMGRVSEARELREQAAAGLRVLAEQHPHPLLQDVREGVRVDRDLELQPI